jgi:predicted metal-dependent TIM-barrel fold hydrolase
MYYIDPHIHMVSRTTDDYELIAKMGCVAVSEPAFWAGWDRGHVEGFRDYFLQITEYEPKRAAQYGIQHYTWMCINAKEAEDRGMARDVIAILPDFLDKPNVLGIGEIGLNKNTKNEVLTFLDEVDLAARFDQSILVHTPHLADKYQGTRMSIDMLLGDSRIDPERVIIDHCEEHTVRLALENGFWAGMTLYPTTKCTPDRAVDMIELYGPERMLVDTSGDWGPSRPDNIPNFIVAMRRRGHPDSLIRKIVYENPLDFFSQSKNFRFSPPDVAVLEGARV